MDAANLPNIDDSTVTAQAGVLIVQNGRQAGARRPLGERTTFVGRAPNCDIRLNVDGVDALHCLLMQTPPGIELRDLNSIHGTFVNGARVSTALLQNGDLIKVGPFQFKLDRPAPAAPDKCDVVPADDRLRQALRVQTAAVAAQQIALEEEEARLDQRRQDLQRQEQQLAAHLEEKQHQLQLWSDYTRSEKESLRQERLEFEKAQTRQEAELAQSQIRLVHEQRQAGAERQRIDKIYQRLKHRWKLQWAAEKERYQKQAHQLAEEAQRLEERKMALANQHAEFAQFAARVNVEQEQSKQNLLGLRETLTKDQERWRQRCALERNVLSVREREIDEAQGKLNHVRRLIQADKDAWAHQQAILHKELLGLNNRVVNHRMQLQLLEAAIAERAAQTRAAASSEPEPIECEVEVIEDGVEPELPFALPVDDPWQHREAVLGIQLGELSDQRLHLLEQFERLAAVQGDWNSQRNHAANELAALAQRLIEQEESLAQRDQQTAAQELRATQRQTELETLREEMQIWRAQLGARERTFQDEQASQLLELQTKEKSLEEQLASLTEMRQRWTQRRQQEIARQEAAHAHVDAQQKEINDLRAALFAKSQEVEIEQRQLAEKTLALEQYRQELFARADDPNAQSRIERLRRRWLSINADLIRHAKGERESAHKELDRLDEMHTQLAQESSRLDLLENELAEKQALLDERDAKLQHRAEPQARDAMLRIPEETESLPIDKAA